MGWIVLQQFFYKNGFCIKWNKKVDMPSNKETKANQTKLKYLNFEIQPKTCAYLSYLYNIVIESAPGIMVIIVGNEHSD